MDQGEKSDIHIPYSFFKVCPEVFDTRALYVQEHTKYQLNVGYGCRPVADFIVSFGKCGF